MENKPENHMVEPTEKAKRKPKVTELYPCPKGHFTEKQWAEFSDGWKKGYMNSVIATERITGGESND